MSLVADSVELREKVIENAFGKGLHYDDENGNDYTPETNLIWIL